MLSHFTLRCEDMRATSIPSESVDLVIFNYSLCHVDTLAALKEAARIVKPSGRLFIYDHARKGGESVCQ